MITLNILPHALLLVNYRRIIRIKFCQWNSILLQNYALLISQNEIDAKLGIMIRSIHINVSFYNINVKNVHTE